MSNIDLNAIIERCNQVTQDTWTAYIEGVTHTSGSSFIMVTDKNGNRKRDLEVIGATNDDLEFIAHAKQDIPLLIAEIEHLKSMFLNKKNRGSIPTGQSLHFTQTERLFIRIRRSVFLYFFFESSPLSLLRFIPFIISR